MRIISCISYKTICTYVAIEGLELQHVGEKIIAHDVKRATLTPKMALGTNPKRAQSTTVFNFTTASFATSIHHCHNGQ